MKMFVYGLREHDEKKYFDEYCEKYGFTYDYSINHPVNDDYKLAEGYDVVSVVPFRIDENLIQKFYDGGARHICTRSIGLDHIDVDYCKKIGMGVTHVQYPSDSVADYTLMLMLMCLRQHKRTDMRADVQDYSLEGKIGRTLSDCTVGVIGTGRIGEDVITRLKAFGGKVICYDAYRKESLKDLYVDLDTLYQESDVITLHVPMNKENYHMIDENAIAKMKDGVILINTARGPLIDSRALVEALENEKVGGAGLDVIEDENGLFYMNHKNTMLANKELSILRGFSNVIVTPHVAFYTEKTVQHMVWNVVKGAYDDFNGIENELVVSRSHPLKKA